MGRSAAVVGLIVLLWGGTTPAAAFEQESLTCFGQRATIVGTDNQDHLVGTDGNDVIVGLKGRDVIEGKGGDDLICAGPGRARITEDVSLLETVIGGPGHDRIDGGSGPDEIYGGAGNDFIRGGPGSDFLIGSPGDDVIRAGAGADFFRGGDGNDLVFLGRGNDHGSGSDGDDEVHGGPGNDDLGSDKGFSCGGSAFDTCDAGGLSDKGADFTHGGRGDDLIAFGLGDDVIEGGRGQDEATFSTHDASSVFVADLKRGEASGAGSDVVRGIEDLSAYSRGDISLFGDAGSNELAGGAARDSGGKAEFVGRSGNDTFLLWPPINRGEVGPIAVDAGRGDDVIDLAACSSSEGPMQAIFHSVVAGDGNDVVLGSCVDDEIFGGPGDDTLKGEEGIDTVDGGDGEDTCEGEFVSNCEH